MKTIYARDNRNYLRTYTIEIVKDEGAKVWENLHESFKEENLINTFYLNEEDSILIEIAEEWLNNYLDFNEITKEEN